MIVPTLRVGTHPVTLRVTAFAQTQSVQGGIPTRSVGTISQHCRSELAREEPEDAAVNQAARVIVDDLREQARSYREQLNDPEREMI
ncbi:hypothetical protein C1751_19990 [Pseudomonas fluorescens]|nr:hypothetical protein C1751_19990 [Pseudomonas fluorescens]